MPLDLPTILSIASGAAGAVGGIFGNRAQNQGIQNALGSQNLGFQQGLGAITGGTQQGINAITGGYGQAANAITGGYGNAANAITGGYGQGLQSLSAGYGAGQKSLSDLYGQGGQALSGAYQQGRADLGPYRNVGSNALKQLEFLTYGKNLSDFSQPNININPQFAAAGAGFPTGGGFPLPPGGGGFPIPPGGGGFPTSGGGAGGTNPLGNFAGVNPTTPGAIPGSSGGATSFQNTNLSQYQPSGGSNALKGIAGGVGALGAVGLGGGLLGAAIGGGGLAGSALLGLGSLATGPFAPIVFGIGLAASQLFGRHNDDKLRATDLTNAMTKIVWGDNIDGKGGLAALVRAGQISPQQASQMAQDTWSQYAAKLPTLADPTITQNSLQDQYRYFSKMFDPQNWAGIAAEGKAGGAAGGTGGGAPPAKMAMGGPVGFGTDTVPAMLTPGEFVINRQAAQSIGQPRLNALNATGYAQGGMVQPNPFKLPVSAPQRDVYGNVTNYIPGFNAQTQQWDFNPNTGQAYAPGQTTEGVGSHYQGNDLYSSTNQLIKQGNPLQAQAPAAPAAAPATQKKPPATTTATPSTIAPPGSNPTLGKPANVWSSAPPNPDEWMKPSTVQGPTPNAQGLPAGFNIGLGSQDPAINRQVYGSNYFPGSAAGSGIGTFFFSNGWPQGKQIPVNAQQFSAMNPQDQQLYRTMLAKFHSSQGAAPVLPVLPQPVAPQVTQNQIAPVNPIGGAAVGGGAPGGITPPPTAYGNYPAGYIPTQAQGPEWTDYTTSPLYQLQLREGEKNLNRYLLSRGRSNSSFGVNALNQFQESLLANEAEKNYQRVQQLAQLGYGAAGQSAGAANQYGQNLAGLYQGLGQNLSGLYANQGQQMANLYTGQGGNLANLFTGQGQNLSNLYTGQGGNLANLYTGQGQALANLYGLNALNTGQLQLGQGANNAQLAAGLGGIPADIIRLLMQGSYFGSQNRNQYDPTAFQNQPAFNALQQLPWEQANTDWRVT